MDVGVRVVRGPDWKWNDQDDGEGHVGTLISPYGNKYPTVQSGSVFVQWDSGRIGNYRVGFEDYCDLLVLDSSLAGKIFDKILLLVQFFADLQFF